MATVRITKELTEQITRAARAKFKDSIAKAEDSRPDDHWGDVIYEKIFGDYIPIMEQLPAEFFGTTSNIQIQKVGGAACNLAFNLSAPRRWPNAIPANAPAERNYYGAALTLTHDLAWGELHAEVVAWKERCEQARKQAREFTEGVSKILSSFSTLAPALKEWPPLWELVPEWAKNKHKEVVVREKKTKPNIDGDTLGKLTGVMTAVKLGGL